MKQSFYACASGLVLCSLVTAGSTQAQIVPDTTLPQNSNVTLEGNTNVINGGTVAGSNLFHSFEQFGLPTGNAAYFNNALEIQNIISRVTGSSISNIDGLIKANGTANLFLLNPNGVILGPNASLDIGGSFLASTASSLKFADETQFSAIAPQATPLLTVSVPIGLQFGRNPGSIVNQSQAQSLSGETNSFGGPVGLQVPAGKTLALVGGNVALEGGNLTVTDGRIELGGVSGDGLVGLNVDGDNLSLSFPDDLTRADVSLTKGALVDASGVFGGDIQVQGRQITLADGSQIVIQTQGSETEGALTITASESVELTEESGLLTGSTDDDGTGGNITIATEQLSVQDSEISTNALLASEGPRIGRGEAGNLVVTATELIELIGTSADGQVPSGLFTQATGENDAGDLTITTGQLIIQDGAQVEASALGEGSGGTVTVTATESVTLTGTSADGQLSSSLSTQAEGGGDAGNLTITTGQLVIEDGAQVEASALGEGSGGTVTVEASSVTLTGTSADGQSSSLSTQAEGGGNAGDLTITTGQLIIEDGAQVEASALGEGFGGTVTVTASESVTLTGTSADGQSSSLSTQAKGGGDAGNLTITTGELIVRDKAQAAVSSEGSGAAGNITVTANSIQLDNQATLTAQSEEAEGGNITLQAQDLLLLRDNSSISTKASSPKANNGNITINTNVVLAVPSENSDIAATAEGKGGDVEIKANGIVGTQVSEQLTPQSDIAGTGGVTIEAEVTPVTTSKPLPAEVVDVTQSVVQSCGGSGEALSKGTSEFTITGRGGLPPTPSEVLRGEAPLVDLGTPAQAQAKRDKTIATNSLRSKPVVPVEAQGWKIGRNGEVVLTAQAHTDTPHSPWLTAADCPASSAPS